MLGKSSALKSGWESTMKTGDWGDGILGKVRVMHNAFIVSARRNVSGITYTVKNTWNLKNYLLAKFS